MTIQRIVAATAAILTVLLLQATLVSPLAVQVPVSLPAVLVAAIALSCGAGAAIAVGFSAGLLADLTSAHPAGILALAWMLLGILCCVFAEMIRGRRAQILAVAVAAAATSALVLLALTALDRSGASVSLAVTTLLPAFVIDLVLAAMVLPLVTRAVASDSLRRVGPGGSPPLRPRTLPAPRHRTGSRNSSVWSPSASLRANPYE